MATTESSNLLSRAMANAGTSGLFERAMSNIGRSREDELRDYQSIRERMLEEERKRKLEPLRRSSEESVKQLGESVKLQEENKGVSGTLLGSMMSSARDVFKREGYDNEYLRQIEDNNRTLSSLVKAKKENPEDEDRYNLMIDTIRAKNDILSNAVGGDLKNKTTAQLAALAVGTAAEMVPTLGGGMTKAGKATILAEEAATAGYKTLGKKALSSMTGSIAKESAVIGAIGGTAEAFAAEDATPAERAAIIAGSTATSVLLGVIGSTLLKSGFNNLGKKLNRFKVGERVEFSPTEKSTIQSVSPEAKETKPFDTIGIKSPLADTEKDLMAKTVASTQEEKSIEKIISKYVPENDVNTVSRILKNVNNPDEVVKIIDSFDPEAKRLAISKKIASTDNEKQVDNLISDIVPEKERATVSRLLSGMEDENQISKILADFEEKAPETPKTPKPTMEEPKKTVKATEDELEEARKYATPEEFVKAQGDRYHGTSSKIDNLKTDEEIYSPQNIYGQGFYTTDNLKVSEGYSKKGGGKEPTIYKVSERQGTKLYDLEKPAPDNVLDSINKTGFFGEEFEKGTKLKEVYDEIRMMSQAREFSVDEAQEMFDEIKDILSRQGYGGLEHTGGILTKGEKHKVKIFWNPKNDIKTTESKTRSQLTDIWKKAQETKIETPSGEPKKTVKTTEGALIEEVGWYKAPDGFVVGKPKIYKGVEYTNIKTEASTADFAVDQYNSGWITNIETKPEFRNQGKAKELVKTGLMFLKERGVDIVRVIPENDISKRLFESFGFKKNGREFVLTKSQLTDIWKKAKGTKIETPKAKPKSVAQEEFVKSRGEIVYHGTDSSFDVFSSEEAFKNSRDISGSRGAGIFFTTRPGVAEGYPRKSGGKIIKANVDLKEPFIIDANGGKFSEIPIDTIVDANGSKGKLSDIVEDVVDEASPDGFVNVNQIARAIKDSGSGEYYDGLIVKNVKDPGMRTKDINEIADTIIVFDEKRIKKIGESAIDAKKAKGTKIETPKVKPKSGAQKVYGKSESPIIKRFNEKLDEAHKLDPNLPTTSHKEQLKLVAEEIADDPQKVFNDGMYGSGTSGKTLKTTKLAAIIENARLKNDYKTRSEAIIAAARHGRKSGQEVEMFKALIENDPTNKGILDLVSARMGAVKSRYKKLVVKEGEDIVDAVVRNAKQKAKSITRKESAKRVASAKKLIMSLSC